MGTMVAKTVVDAKGDLIAGTAADTVNRLAVGNNGETLVADSSTSTGLRYQGSMAAAKNCVVGGGFDVWQRGTTFSTAGVYSADRWYTVNYGAAATLSWSRQTATNTNASYAMQIQRASGQTGTALPAILTVIESANVVAYAGKTVTASVWLKRGADAPSSASAYYLQVRTGTGTDEGAVSCVNATWTGYVANAPASPPAVTTTSTQFTYTFTVASNVKEMAILVGYQTAGTAGTNDWLQVENVQLEIGSVPTTFTRAGGTIQGELAACQRYFEKSFGQATAPSNTASSGGVNRAGTAYSTVGWRSQTMNYAVVKRTNPTLTFYKTSNSSTNGRWAYYTTSWQTSTSTVVSNANEVAFSVEVGGTYLSNAGYIVDGEWDSNAEL
jgi:hypothetical protein